LYFPILDKVSVVKLWKRYIYRCWQLTWDESWRIIIFHSERAVAVSPICRKSQHQSFRQGAPCRRARRTKMICSSRVLPQAAAWPVRRSIASCLTTLTIVIRFPRTRSVRTSGPPRSPESCVREKTHRHPPRHRPWSGGSTRPSAPIPPMRDRSPFSFGEWSAKGGWKPSRQTESALLESTFTYFRSLVIK